MMPLSVVETDRKDAIETVEGPSEAGRGVLSAGKNDKAEESVLLVICCPEKALL